MADEPIEADKKPSLLTGRMVVAIVAIVALAAVGITALVTHSSTSGSATSTTKVTASTTTPVAPTTTVGPTTTVPVTTTTVPAAHDDRDHRLEDHRWGLWVGGLADRRPARLQPWPGLLLLSASTRITPRDGLQRLSWMQWWCRPEREPGRRLLAQRQGLLDPAIWAPHTDEYRLAFCVFEFRCQFK